MYQARPLSAFSVGATNTSVKHSSDEIYKLIHDSVRLVICCLILKNMISK